MNEYLCQHYLSQPYIETKIERSDSLHIKEALSKAYPTWTWEPLYEEMGVLSVAVYIPGRILCGRAYSDVNLKTLHNIAIYDACECLMTEADNEMIVVNQESVSTKEEPTNITPSQEDILKYVKEQAERQQKTEPSVVDNKEDFYNYSNENGNNEVPFESMTDKCIQEIAPKQDEPVNKFGYTQTQMNRMAKFKTDFEILNNEMFDNYVTTWDSKLTGKHDITPQNIDAFLDWTESLGK